MIKLNLITKKTPKMAEMRLKLIYSATLKWKATIDIKKFFKRIDTNIFLTVIEFHNYKNTTVISEIGNMLE